MKFNSQICTSREQSERLLALGLKKETADMGIYYSELYGVDRLFTNDLFNEAPTFDSDEIPAWSLHRILELLPKKVEYNGWTYNLIVNVGEDLIGYLPPVFSGRRVPLEYFYGNDTIYDDCISCIDWLIKEGYFNKEYLV